MEVQEAVDYPRGEGARHRGWTRWSLVGSRLLVAGGMANDLTAAEHALVRVRDDGSALERMANVVRRWEEIPASRNAPRRCWAVRLWSNRFRHPMAES